jgi:hypothetical protein
MKPVICFDFDNTLAMETYESNGWLMIGNGQLKPIEKICDMVHEKHNEGFECHIVTFREDHHIPEVEAFIKQHKLPIKAIHNSSNRSKVPILKKLNAVLMIDDMLEVCVSCRMNNIESMLVDHGQMFGNPELADTFDKIKIS